MNGHVIVLRSPFREYEYVMDKVRTLPGVVGVSPFILNAMMITYHGKTATGVTFKGVDPNTVGTVLDLPEQIVAGSLDGLRSANHAPPPNLPDELSAGAAGPARARPDRVEPPTPTRSHELPAGSISPAGGYDSVLPESDSLPEELNPDPCSVDPRSMPGVVVGIALSRALSLGVGDCIQVTSPAIGYTLGAGALRPAIVKPFRVIGIFQAGFEQYDSKFVYTDLREAQALYQEGDSVTGVEMKVADVDEAREIALRVEEELGDHVYQVIDWMELNHGLFTALRIQQILMSLVLGLIILVAAFTVIATLVMVVLDKSKEIATLKAMGASDAQVMRAFLYQGLIIGLLGATSGSSAGYVICRWILAYGLPLDPKVYFIDHLPVQIRPEEFAFTAAFAVVVCLLATLWPALHAARLRPAEAFRNT